MCGLFGAIGPLPAWGLDRAAEALRHRGPDSEGRFTDGDVSLLHRRLKIIDLSQAAAQPMGNEDGSVQVVFNGEIYNHQALRKQLEAAGHRFRSRSDTEAIVHGYEEWGERLVDHLDGMFAFAVWDRARRRCLVARDRAGKKPLFWSETGGVFRFGSTIESLHASGLPAGFSVERLPYYLAYGFVPPPETLHAGVQQLPPASLLVWENGRTRVERYWKPSFGTAECADSYEQASARVSSLVEAAVGRRLESDVPLGAFLSGGIDSTIIVGIMARLAGRVRTFSIGFSGDARFDETAYARIASRAFSTEHTEFTLDPTSFDLVETLVRHHDGPFGDSSAIPTYVVSRLTRQHVTVALTGDGGDELFCGYVRFLAAEAAERVPLLVRRLAGGAARSLPKAAVERTLLGKARRFLDASALPLADRMARWNSYFFDPRSILRADVNVDAEAPLAWQRALFAAAEGRTTLSRVLEHNFASYLPYDLLVKADRTSMAHGLELRSPFLDTALVEYAASLPPGYLRRGTQTKRILKHAFRELLPREILHRGKMGFGIPLGTWFRGSLREYLNDHLGKGARLDEYLDRAAVDRILGEHLQGVSDHGHKLWALLTLEIWLRMQASQRLAHAA
jgi:asparagine synthase (glutamine-hydrolysing)